MRSLPFRSFTLSEEQQVIVDVVEKGHNVYFGGIADCGKTFVARHVLNITPSRDFISKWSTKP